MAGGLLNTQCLHGYTHLGISVSGGSDSLALLYLLADWAKDKKIKISAATVDHGLRPEAGAEARSVARSAEILQVRHKTLLWRDYGRGNIAAQGRAARIRLLSDWAKAEGIEAVCLGHTANDIAETLIMRLGRGAGVDGLAAMKAARQEAGVTWLRPFLHARRTDLQAYLSERGIAWHTDPGNSDQRYERARIRKALQILEPLGLGIGAMAESAQHLRAAATTLAKLGADWVRRHVHHDRGVLSWPLAAFLALSEEAQFRILSTLLHWRGQTPYPPRGRSVLRILENITQPTTVNGCFLQVNAERLEIIREAVQMPRLLARQGIYDQVWQIKLAADCLGMGLAPLGKNGLRQFPHWSDAALTRMAAMATPALWQGDTLLAAPVLSPSPLLAAWSASGIKTELVDFFLR